MYIVLKIALTADGYIGLGDQRLLISSKKDLEDVDKIRSEVDAILIGANTVRIDNPSLLVKKSKKSPIRVVLSRSGQFDPNLNLFSDNKSKTMVYHSNKNIHDLNYMENLAIENVLKDLSKLGVHKLLVEGGAEIFKQFYELSLFNELRVSIGAMFLGQSGISIDLDSSTNIGLKSVESYGSSLVHVYENKKPNINSTLVF